MMKDPSHKGYSNRKLPDSTIHLGQFRYEC